MSISKGLALFWMALLVGGGLFIRWFSPESAFETAVDRVLLAPQASHWFGTDSLGRDLLARILVGSQISLLVGLGGSLVAFALGVLWGAGFAWKGGGWDRVAMRITDLFLSVPGFALVAVFALAFESWGIWGLVVALGVTRWMGVARVVRGLVLSTKSLPFIEASRAMGGRSPRILWSHVRPNISGPLWILFGLQIPANILYESFMSFIGLGAQAPQTSWGLLVQEGWRSLSTSPHLILAPALVLFLTVWSLHVLMERKSDRVRLRTSWLESSRL